MPPKSWFDRFDKKEKKVMSEADKLFEELGYEYIQPIPNHDKCHLYIKYMDGIVMCVIKLYIYDHVVIKEANLHSEEPITMQELKAINKKCEELRME